MTTTDDRTDVILRLDGRVAHLTIDRPEVRNALSTTVITDLERGLDAAEAAACTVVVLRGAGGTLSAGADLPHLLSIVDDRSALDRMVSGLGRVLDRLERGPMISVAVVEGFAVAGGCEILLACDLAVVADEARIGDRHLEYGLIPGGGGSVRLPAAVPAPLARRLLYTGEIVSGATAAAWGMVSHCVPGPDVERASADLLARLARHPPAALTAMKRLYRTAVSTPAHSALAAEREALIEHVLHSEAPREGLTAFAQHRAPRFRTTDS